MTIKFDHKGFAGSATLSSWTTDDMIYASIDIWDHQRSTGASWSRVFRQTGDPKAPLAVDPEFRANGYESYGCVKQIPKLSTREMLRYLNLNLAGKTYIIGLVRADGLQKQIAKLKEEMATNATRHQERKAHLEREFREAQEREQRHYAILHAYNELLRFGLEHEQKSAQYLQSIDFGPLAAYKLLPVESSESIQNKLQLADQEFLQNNGEVQEKIQRLEAKLVLMVEK